MAAKLHYGRMYVVKQKMYIVDGFIVLINA